MTELERARLEEACRVHAYTSMRHNPTTVLEIFDKLTEKNWKPTVSEEIIALRAIWVAMRKNTQFLPPSEKYVKDVLEGARDEELKQQYLPFYLAGKNDRSNNFG